MYKFVATKFSSNPLKFRGCNVRRLFLVLILSPISLFIQPVMADSTVSISSNADSGFIHADWQQDASRLNDDELGKVHGKGLSFTLHRPELIPVVILWDESGKPGKTGNTLNQNNFIRISAPGVTTNKR